MNNILDNGVVMSPGKELDQYARARGLCRLCGRTQTHQRAGIFLTKLRSSWKPITVKDEARGTYLVYKGYCIQPTCYSLDDAKTRLGEKPFKRESSTATRGAREASFSSISLPPLSQRRNSSVGLSSSTSSFRTLPSHPSSPFQGKRRLGGRTSDGASIVSNTSAASMLWSDEEESHNQQNDSTSSSLAMSYSTFDNIPISINAPTSSSAANGEYYTAQDVALRDLLDAFLHDPKSTCLHLSGVPLFEVNIASLMTTLRAKKLTSSFSSSGTGSNSVLPLDSFLADGCNLNESRLSKLVQGLLQENIQVSKMSLRSNDLDQVHGLVPFLRSSSTSRKLDELNLSQNRLGDRGVGAVMSALAKNSFTAIRKLNFSNNQVWSLSDSFTIFLSTNQSLTTLHLESNFLQDAGVEMLAMSIASNQDTCLATLYLGDNGIGPWGAKALAAMLSKNTSLQSLRVDNNKIGKKGAEALFQALEKNNQTLYEVTGLYTNQISSKELITAIETLLQKRAEQNITDSLLQARSPERCNHDSLTDIEFCYADTDNGLESGRARSPIIHMEIDGALIADESTIVSATPSERSDNDNDDDVDDDDDQEEEQSQFEEQEITLGLDSLLPLPSLYFDLATSGSPGLRRSASYRNAVDALDLASPSQHHRLVKGSEQGFGHNTTVCLGASGNEQAGFETIFLPFQRRKPSETEQHVECEPPFEATEMGIEVSLENFDQNSSPARSVMKETISRENWMPPLTRPELQQRDGGLEMAMIDDSPGGRNRSFESERQLKQKVLDRELESEEQNRIHHSSSARSRLRRDTSAANPLIPLRLTLFQAAPLSYLDRKMNKRHIFPLLDFEYESSVLQQALKDAESTGACIEIEHEVATTDRLSAFFAQGGRRLLHLSCHGHPNWLALENGFGDMQPMFVEDLRSFIEAGGGSLDLVFVSACHSLPAGQAFLKAGVRHVVCAKQDAAFRDEACAEFARCFYRALACKKTLKQAFNMAKEAVRVSPLVTDARIESDKFLLLPELEDDSYHDVAISFTDHRPRPEEMIVRHTHQPRTLKRLPQTFVGREADMYRIIEALRSSDLVQVYGGLATGKSTLVSAVSKYILQRKRSFLFDGALWIPNAVTGDSDKTGELLNKCMLFILNTPVSVAGLSAYKDSLSDIFEALHGKRVLLVFDVRCYASQKGVRNLEVFLGDLLQALSVKCTLIANSPLKFKMTSRTVEVGPLDHESSAILFSRLVQSRHFSSQELAKILAPLRSQKELQYPIKRNAVLFEKMGWGHPSEIEQTATNMSEPDLLELVRIGKRPSPLVTTRVELEERIKSGVAEEAAALRQKQFLRARDIRDSIEELRGLRQYLKTVDELMVEATTLPEQLEKATHMRRYDTAEDIQRRLESLEKQVLEEQRCQKLYLKTVEERMEEALIRREKLRADAEAKERRNDSATGSTSDVQYQCSWKRNGNDGSHLLQSTPK